MRKVLFTAALAIGLIFSFGDLSQAQDWSEYKRGSSEWHRMNREAMTRPWKRDIISGRVRSGRRAGGKRAYAKRATRRATRRR